MNDSGIACPCGGICKSSTHEVKTDKGVGAWLKYADIKPPVKVEQVLCNSCGRYGLKVIKDNKVIHKRGI